jgi:chromosome segregation ATPase
VHHDTTVETSRKDMLDDLAKSALEDPGTGRTTVPLTRGRQIPTRESETPARGSEIPTQLEKLLVATLAKLDTLSTGIADIQTHRRDLIEESKAVGRNYKQLFDKVAAERDKLSRELEDARGQQAINAKKQAQATDELRREIERQRRESECEIREAEDRARTFQKRIGELESQLREALDSRDRIVARIGEVEQSIEDTALTLREELDRARDREARVRDELDDAHKEIATLRILAGPPSRRS